MSSKFINQSIPQKNINIRCNDIIIDGSISGNESQTISTVTQTVGISNPVTCNGYYGNITTVSATIASNGKNLNTTVNNDIVESDDVILLSFIYNGTDGHPHINLKNVNNGNFNFSIYNSSSTESLNGTFNIFFKVIKNSA